MKLELSQRTHPWAVASWLGVAGILLAGVLSSPGCGSDARVEDEDQAVEQDTGDLAPDFVVQDVTGARFSLSETAGQVRLIDFWATWCPPCREEIPMLIELDRTYRDQGLTILAISDESAEVLREFVADQGVTYKNLVDNGDVAEAYMVPGLPTGFLIDREGKVVERFFGPKPAKILEKRIRELLDLPPA